MHGSSIRRCLRVAGIGVALGVVGSAIAASPPLKRDLSSYAIFAESDLHVNDVVVHGQCSIGVNCAKPSRNAACGTAGVTRPVMEAGSQLAADEVRIDGGVVGDLFRNLKPTPPPPDVSILGSFVTPLALPILLDVDGDGDPSCGPRCTPDFGDLEKACGFPDPFPDCDPARDVEVKEGGDCSAGEDPAHTGDGKCDLLPGTYGTLTVRDGGKVNFLGGDYVFCAVGFGKRTTALASHPAVLALAGDGVFHVNNGSTFGGGDCGDFTLFVEGKGQVRFGHGNVIAGRFCAPRSEIRLGGRGNQLTGQFVAFRIGADPGVDVTCCAACACFDRFAPSSVAVGGLVTLSGGCDLSGVTGVRLVDALGASFAAEIVQKSSDELVFRVPAGTPPGAYLIAIDSSAGTFTSAAQLTVTP